jgi:hypothetical protein
MFAIKFGPAIPTVEVILVVDGSMVVNKTQSYVLSGAIKTKSPLFVFFDWVSGGLRVLYLEMDTARLGRKLPTLPGHCPIYKWLLLLQEPAFLIKGSG